MAGKFNIDGDAIRQLAQILVETDLTEIEYESESSRVRVARNISMVTTVPNPIPLSVPLPNGVTEGTTGGTIGTTDPATHPGVIKSPMVGTIYVAAEPTAAPFVKVGDTVSIGQTLLIIEAMKVMNPIKAVKAGKVTQIFFQNAQPVEFGEPLLIIE